MLADRCGANLPDFQKALWLNMKEFTGLKSQLQRPQSRGPDDIDLLEFCLNRKYEVNNHMGVQESCLEQLGGECGNIGIGGCQAGSQLSNGGVHGVSRPRQGCLGCREASVQRGIQRSLSVHGRLHIQREQSHASFRRGGVVSVYNIQKSNQVIPARDHSSTTDTDHNRLQHTVKCARRSG